MMAPPAVGSPMSCRVGAPVAPRLLCTVGVTIAPPALPLPPLGLWLGRLLWLAWAVGGHKGGREDESGSGEVW